MNTPPFSNGQPASRHEREASPAGQHPATPTPAVRIKVIEKGPLQVRGPVELLDHDGAPHPVPGRTFFLCRCGESRSKPFCDGTHSRIGFAAAERAVAEHDARIAPSAGRET